MLLPSTCLSVVLQGIIADGADGSHWVTVDDKGYGDCDGIITFWKTGDLGLGYCNRLSVDDGHQTRYSVREAVENILRGGVYEIGGLRPPDAYPPHFLPPPSKPPPFPSGPKYTPPNPNFQKFFLKVEVGGGVLRSARKWGGFTWWR